MVVTQRLWDMLERTKQERLGKAACRGVLQALFVVDVLCRRQNLLPSNWIWVTVLISGPFDSSYHMLEGFLLSQLLCKDLSCGYIRKELDFKIRFCYNVLCSRIRCKVQVFCTMWCQLYPEWFLLMLYRWRLLPSDTHNFVLLWVRDHNKLFLKPMAYSQWKWVLSYLSFHICTWKFRSCFYLH